jgi:transcriptional regulator with XRE-family HTH domain
MKLALVLLLCGVAVGQQSAKMPAECERAVHVNVSALSDGDLGATISTLSQCALSSHLLRKDRLLINDQSYLAIWEQATRAAQKVSNETIQAIADATKVSDDYRDKKAAEKDAQFAALQTSCNALIGQNETLRSVLMFQSQPTINVQPTPVIVKPSPTHCMLWTAGVNPTLDCN